MKTIELHGCRTFPLLDYLKGLGCYRIISTQKDTSALCYWNKSNLSILTSLSQEEFLSFFLDDYAPSPLFGPWGARSGFYKTGSEATASKALEKLLSVDNPRFNRLREAQSRLKKIMISLGLEEKPKDESKVEFLRMIRNWAPDDMIEWIDAVYILTDNEERPVSFTPLLGTGGNEGSYSYFSNYLQSLCEAFVDKTRRDDSKELLIHSLYGKGSPKLSDLNAGQFNPGAICEINAGEGYLQKKKTMNPWDIILGFEGLQYFSGSCSKRYSTGQSGEPSFPFIAQPTSVGGGSLASLDVLNKKFEAEFWVPVWRTPKSNRELIATFREARAHILMREARKGLDYAMAVASLGVDRGFDSFIRFGRIARQGSGDQANAIAVHLAEHKVKALPGVGLIDEVSGWLSLLESKEKISALLMSSLRNTQAAIVDYCHHGTKERLQQVLISLGTLHSALSKSSIIEDESKGILPKMNIKLDWFNQCNDGTTEYRIAASLASIFDSNIGSIKENIFPVTRENGQWRWKKGSQKCVWMQTSLIENMIRILKRRLVDGERLSLNYTPLGSLIFASSYDINRFLEGKVNDKKILDLWRGLALIRWDSWKQADYYLDGELYSEIPSDYAILKLTYLPGGITLNKKGFAKLSFNGKDGIQIKPDARVIEMLGACRGVEALRIAAKRIQIAGFVLKGQRRGMNYDPGFNPDAERSKRLAASLLIPFSGVDVLMKKVVRDIEILESNQKGEEIIKEGA
ncbi:MAG: type I-U CRISPR-associated protein Csx17 [Methanomassiliicoccales archaeon]